MQTFTPMPIPSPELLLSERRAAPRQRRLVRVLVLPDDCALDEPYGAWVVDTSPSGMRLLLDRQEIEEGDLLWLRRPRAAAATPWVAVRVCNRVQREGKWELGCAFAAEGVSRAGLCFQ
jgi:hypothetical protein